MKKLLFTQFLFLNITVLFAQQRFSNNPIRAITHAYDTSTIVCFGESHDKLELLNFYIELINDKEFQERVDDIVLELGNSRYQNVLDDYISGKNVDYNEVRKIWFDATNSLLQLGDSSLVELLINEIRKINSGLTDETKFRVVVVDPPLDWSKVRSATDFDPWLGRRDLSFIKNVWYEVLDKNRKGFIIMGRRHLLRNDPRPLNYVSFIDILEKRVGNRIPIFRVEENDRIQEGVYPIEETELSEKPIISNSDFLYKDAVDAIIYFNKLTPLVIHPFKKPSDLNVLNERSMIVHREPFKFNSYDYLSYLITTKGTEGIHSFFALIKEKDSKIGFNEQLIQMLVNTLKNDEWKELIEKHMSEMKN